MVSVNYKHTSPLRTRKKRKSHGELSSLDDGSSFRNTPVSSEIGEISGKTVDSEELNIAKEFAKLDPYDSGWIHDYHLAELLVRIMWKDQRMTTYALNKTFRNLRSPEPDRESPLTAYLHHLRKTTRELFGTFHYFEQRRMECWKRNGISLIVEGESPKEIISLNRKTIGSIIEKVGLSVSEDNEQHGWDNRSIRKIHIDDAVRLIPDSFHWIMSVFEREICLQREELKRRKQKKRGKPLPREIEDAVANGVRLGCSKCRYQIHGCTRCREKAGLL